MIANFFLWVVVSLIKVAQSPLIVLDSLIPANVSTGITTTLSNLGTKINLVYNLIPANDTLWTVLLTTIYLTAAYFSVRLIVFIINEFRGSGGKV